MQRETGPKKNIAYLQKHTKIYLTNFGYDINDASIFVPSEITPEERAVDIHHIIGRGRGGKDRIENLIALTRAEHDDYGDKNEYIVLLLEIHRKRLIKANIKFDNDWFDQMIEHYG